MVSLGSLWLPIVLSAVFVWIASAVIWMALPHHKTDWKRLPDEETLRNALKTQSLAPGQYVFPYAGTGAAMKTPEMQRKYQEGPVGFLTIVPSGTPAMGGKMVGSFAYYLVVGVVVAYLTSRTLTAETEYLQVFRVAGTSAWLAYAFAGITDSIWFGRPWSTSVKNVVDGLVYGLLTAGTFGWLWP